MLSSALEAPPLNEAAPDDDLEDLPDMSEAPETAPGEFARAIYDRRSHVCWICRGINPDGPQPRWGFTVSGGRGDG